MADVFPADFVSMQNQVIQKAHLEATDDRTRVKNWLNSAYYTISIEVGFYVSDAVLSPPLTAGASRVDFPASMITLDYIVPTASGQTFGPMDEVSFEEILEQRAWSGGTVSTGAPSRFRQFSAPNNYIEFWPAATGGEVFTFHGQTLPPPMVNDTDLPVFPEPYSKVIEYHALIEAAEQKADLLMLQQFSTQYAQGLQDFRAFTNVPGRVQQFRVERRRPWPKANSVDQGW